MRITNGILTREAVHGFQAQMRDLADARQRAASGQRLNSPSDDPVSAASIMQSSGSLRAVEQYRSNLATAQSRLAVEDSVLDQLGTTLVRAREIAVSQAGDPADEATRRTARAEVEGVLEFVTSLANTRLAGSYLFGGDYADTAPLDGGVADPARPATGSARLEIGSGTFVETTHGAQEIFLDSGVMDALSALSTALGDNDATAVQTAAEDLDTAFDNVQSIIGDLGARMSQLDVTGSNLESLEVTLSKFRSELADADMAQAVTELLDRQGSLEAAMLVNSKIMNITLADYLR